MQPTKIDNRQEDIFKSRLSNELNPKHEMMMLSRLIPWDSLEVELADLYQSVRNVGGQPPKPIRLMIGILLLQHLHNLSDEQVVRTWVENPYWQFFCGYDFLQWNFPIDPSSLTHSFRSCQIRSGKGEGSEKSYRRHHRDAKEHRIPHRFQTLQQSSRKVSQACH